MIQDIDSFNIDSPSTSILTCNIRYISMYFKIKPNYEVQVRFRSEDGKGKARLCLTVSRGKRIKT